MRKNLTISLDQTDWALVSSFVKTTRDTYSGFFHRLIQKSLGSREVDPKLTAKYRRLFEKESEFMTRRAAVFAKARRFSNKPN